MPDPIESAQLRPIGELSAPQWAVISFERCEASGLTYSEAVVKQADLEKQRVPGLSIVTDEAAARYKMLLESR